MPGEDRAHLAAEVRRLKRKAAHLRRVAARLPFHPGAEPIDARATAYAAMRARATATVGTPEHWDAAQLNRRIVAIELRVGSVEDEMISTRRRLAELEAELATLAAARDAHHGRLAEVTARLKQPSESVDILLSRMASVIDRKAELRQNEAHARALAEYQAKAAELAAAERRLVDIDAGEAARHS